MYRIGDLYAQGWQRLSTIVAARSYTHPDPELRPHFTHILTLTNPYTRSGKIEMSVNWNDDKDWENNELSSYYPPERPKPEWYNDN